MFKKYVPVYWIYGIYLVTRRIVDYIIHIYVIVDYIIHIYVIKTRKYSLIAYLVYKSRKLIGPCTIKPIITLNIKKLSPCHKLIFDIPISLLHNVVDLRYFKL